MVLAAALAASGCSPPAPAPEAQERRVLAQVIDETDFLAQAGQVEGEALAHLWARLKREPVVGGPQPKTDNRQPTGGPKAPSAPDLVSAPGNYRGARTVFVAKMVALEEFTPAGECARLGQVARGLVLLNDGGLVAFLTPGGDAIRRPDGTSKIPGVGNPVRLTGLFLKRWIALDGSGSRYAAIPLVASGVPQALSCEEAGPVAGRVPAKGLLPLTALEAPPVWSRPVVELDAKGALRLDGRPVTRQRLADELRGRAGAAGKTPLGESALVAVILADPAAPADARGALEQALPTKAVFRPAP
jgi:hypothetical protein